MIISDAFRYEAAQELFAAMRGTDRYQATMDSMLGVLPSYTALGMASLCRTGTGLCAGRLGAGRWKIIQWVGGAQKAA
ncbi:PglZ domain-containing protein [Novosphingobium sp.]|uniref:PglZ domain-containing protein n=1 Tax=Novosphingobium sp. TaxID=1874826 RepID=UPI0025EE8679|nr:PglZ domain-containing protein [Novosphingobium sp.]